MKKSIPLFIALLLCSGSIWAESFGTFGMWTAKKYKKDYLLIQGSVDKKNALKIHCTKGVLYIDSTLTVNGKDYAIRWEGDDPTNSFDLVIDRDLPGDFEDNLSNALKKAKTLEAIYGKKDKIIALPVKNIAKHVDECVKISTEE